MTEGGLLIFLGAVIFVAIIGAMIAVISAIAGSSSKNPNDDEE